VSADVSSPLLNSEDGAPILVHAAAVVVGESGVIIRGAPGAGKSSLALSLIAAAELAGQFARLVGDDRVELRRSGGRLIVTGHPLIRGMVERRGQGILNVAHEMAAVARLTVDIIAPEDATRYPDEMKNCVTLCGVKLPVLALLKTTAAYDSALEILVRLQQSGAI